MLRRLAAALLLAAALPAQGQVYKWVDKEGKVHYSNTPPTEASSAKPVEDRLNVTDGMSPEERAAAEQRFSKRAEEEERVWQERQKAQAAQQASSPPADSDDGRTTYREPYYYDDWGGGYIPGPIRRPDSRPLRPTQLPVTRPAPPARASSGGRGLER